MSARFRTSFDFVHSEIPFNLSHPHLHAAPPAILPLCVYATLGTMTIDSSLIRMMGSLPAAAAESQAEEEVHAVLGQSAPFTRWKFNPSLQSKVPRVEFGLLNDNFLGSLNILPINTSTRMCTCSTMIVIWFLLPLECFSYCIYSYKPRAVRVLLLASSHLAPPFSYKSPPGSVLDTKQVVRWASLKAKIEKFGDLEKKQWHQVVKVWIAASCLPVWTVNFSGLRTKT